MLCDIAGAFLVRRLLPQLLQGIGIRGMAVPLGGIVTNSLFLSGCLFCVRWACAACFGAGAASPTSPAGPWDCALHRQITQVPGRAQMAQRGRGHAPSRQTHAWKQAARPVQRACHDDTGDKE